jgi:hypothetical protein
VCPATAITRPFFPEFTPADACPVAATGVPFRRTKEKAKNAVDARARRHKIARNEPRAKAILLEPRSVKKANSYQLIA